MIRLFLCFALILPFFAWGQIPALPAIEKEIAALKDDPNQADLLAELEKTRDLFLQEKESKEATTRFVAATEAAPNEADRISAELAKPVEEIPAPAFEQIDLATAEKKQSELATELNQRKEAAADLRLLEEEAIRRQATLPDELVRARAELKALQESVMPESGDPESGEALQTRRSAKESALKARIASLEAEQNSFSPLAALRVQQRRLAARETARLETEKVEWDKIRDLRYAAETAAARKLAEARAAAFKDIPELAALTAESADLARQRTEIRKNSATVSDFRNRITELRADVREQRETAVERLQLLESADLKIDLRTGNLLRVQRAGLPTAADLRADLKQNIQIATTAQLEQLELARAAEMADHELPVRIGKLAQRLEGTEVSEEEIRELFEQNQSLTDELLTEYHSYISALKVTNVETREAIAEVETYSRYLDERLLWIPSAPPLGLRDLEVEAPALLALFSPSMAGEWMAKLFSDLRTHPVRWVLAATVFILLGIRRRRYRQILSKSGTEAARKSCLSMTPTFRSAMATTMLALPLPLLLGFLAWRSAESPPFSHGLRDAAGFIFLAGLLRILARPEGLLTCHFGFEAERSRHLRFHLGWIVPVMAPFLFLTTALSDLAFSPAAGRLVFLGMMLVTMTAGHLLFRPSKGLIRQSGGKNWLSKLCYGLSLGLPLAFAVGAILGYLTSVRTVRLQTVGSVWLILFGLFVGAFLTRWILVVRRRMAREQAVKRYLAERTARKNAEEGKEGEGDSETATLEEVEAEAVNVVAVEEQTKRLLRVAVIVFVSLGLWNVWSTSLPALSVLDQVTLYSSDPEAEAPAKIGEGIGAVLTPGADSASSGAVEEAADPAAKRLTLQDVLGSLVALVLTIIAARNLPGLLELSVLRRLSLQPGGNYAVTTMVRYVILAIGLIVALKLMGITWNSVQWLAAAVTLGIGFGLQEIFANFVAGIILLFERPIRLGDIVTVGDVSGKVTQIQIRATRLLQFNGRELIVPNKQFITSELVNWTLSDNRQRFEFKVGVAYGASVERVRDLLVEILDLHPDVLKDPEPMVIFADFGASTLDFKILAHVDSPGFLLGVQSDLHFEILRRFREEDIEIAYPQTDIHIKSLPEGIKQAEEFEDTQKGR